ncbi:hypothetical protein ACEPPN_014049 [Leptodophora sp. 'Broadleaf-Isolate-01']
MEIANIDAIEFNIGDKKHIRVYYQTKDKKIRETSYESDNGCTVHIRLYYLNDARQICECEGEHSLTGTNWRSEAPLQLNKQTNVADGSQLAVARPDRDDATLRVFYQEAKLNNKSLIREVKFRKNQNKWMFQSTSIDGAVDVTRFSAVSAGKTGTVRIYYQGANRLLTVTLWNADRGDWEQFKTVNVDNKLAANAPISAVAWYASDWYSPDDLRVRVYTILESKPKKIAELARNGEDWEDPTDVADIQDVTPDKSSIGVCREKTLNDGAPIFVFFKPRSSFIDMAYPDIEPALAASVKDSYLPRGIPTSL